MTHIIYLRNEAKRAESRTTTNNKPIAPVYKQATKEKIKVKAYSLISHMLERETCNASAIKFAMSIYIPVNQLEYE